MLTHEITIPSVKLPIVENGLASWAKVCAEYQYWEGSKKQLERWLEEGCDCGCEWGDGRCELCELKREGADHRV